MLDVAQGRQIKRVRLGFLVQLSDLLLALAEKLLRKFCVEFLGGRLVNLSIDDANLFVLVEHMSQRSLNSETLRVADAAKLNEDEGVVQEGQKFKQLAKHEQHNSLDSGVRALSRLSSEYARQVSE